MRTSIYLVALSLLGLGGLAQSCWGAPAEATPVQAGGGARVKKVTGETTIRVNGNTTSLGQGKTLALPATVVTSGSRLMLTMPGRKIAIGKNSSVTISASGDIELEPSIGGAVAVQPSDGVVQRISYLPSTEALASALPWSGGDLEEAAGARSKIAASGAEALINSLAVAFAPAADRGGYFKLMLFEGHAEVQVEDEAPIQLQPNEMSQAKVEKGGEMDGEIRCDAFNLEVAVETSALINDFRECWDMGPVEREIERQKEEIRRGDYLSFRDGQRRRSPRQAVEDRQTVRSLRKGLHGGKH